jgi:hypothetical protein
MGSDFLEEVRKVITYEPDTGHFYWLVRQGRQAAGARAGSRRLRGYRQIRINGKMVQAGRLAWLFMKGEWPPEGIKIDHWNRQTDDNRWSNLRLATDAQNSANASIRPDNTSGYPGIHWQARAKLWCAYIHQKSPDPARKKSVKLHLGYFKTKAEAIAARKAAEQHYFGAFAPKHTYADEPLTTGEA